MLTKKLILSCNKLRNCRLISRTVKNFESNTTNSANKTSESISDSKKVLPGRAEYIPNNFDKWLLVWVNRYPKGQVPEKISEEIIYQAKSKARIKTANWMMVFVILMCVSTAYYAKGLAKSGDSIQKRREDWHKQIQEEARQKREAVVQK